MWTGRASTRTLLLVLLVAISTASARRMPARRRSNFDPRALEKLLGGKANLKFGSGNNQHPIVDFNRDTSDPVLPLDEVPSRRMNKLQPFVNPSIKTRLNSVEGDMKPAKLRQGGSTAAGTDDGVTQIFGFDDSATEEENELEEGVVCYKKIMLVKETQYDDVTTCNHVVEPSCFTTHSTVMTKVMDQECKTSYAKECVLRPSFEPRTTKYTVCHENYQRDCDADAEALGLEEVCTTEYDSICTTVHEEFEMETSMPNCQQVSEEECEPTDQGSESCRTVEKQVCTLEDGTMKVFTPNTTCTRVPTTVCGPQQCPLVKKEPICEDKVEQIVVEVMKEVCHLTPKKTCFEKVRLLPKLKEVRECQDVARDVCTQSKVNPKEVMKPVVKKWCGKEEHLQEVRKLEQEYKDAMQRAG